MAPLDFLSAFRASEGQNDALNARWYIVAAVALTAAQAGEHVGELYQLATDGLGLEDRKIVQRRIKEAMLKSAILLGIPRTSQGLGPLFRAIPVGEIDTYAPRTEKMKNKDDDKVREARANKYFETLWGGPEGAKPMKDRAIQYQADHYLLNMKTNYELWLSEDAILDNVETQMVTTGLLICNNSPEQALWHVRGLLRHGGTLEEAKWTQELALAVAREFGAKTGEITKAEDIKL